MVDQSIKIKINKKQWIESSRDGKNERKELPEEEREIEEGKREEEWRERKCEEDETGVSKRVELFITLVFLPCLYLFAFSDTHPLFLRSVSQL